MIRDATRGMFLYAIDVHYFATTTEDMHFTFWACDCLNLIEDILKKACVYEAIWASSFNQSLDLGLLNAFIAQWSPNTNTTTTCYRELGISSWDVFQTSRLLIVREM